MSISFIAKAKTIAKTIDYPAIPLSAGQVSGWKTIPIIEKNHSDPLVPLGPLSKEAGVLTSSIYFGEHSNSPYAKNSNKLEGCLLTLFARQSVARRLLDAERLLPIGHHLLVFDAYRPYQVQKSLYDFYQQKLREKHPEMDDDALDTETQKYVSAPSNNPARPSPHNTGGAIDLAIVRFDRVQEKEMQQIRVRLANDSLSVATRVGLELRLSAILRRHAKMLDFGTPFDHGGEKSALTNYESKIGAGVILPDDDMQACQNRRLLFKVMTQAGFQPYFAEWWHFNAPETQMGAATAGLEHASLGAADFDESNWVHEITRLKVRSEALRLQHEGVIEDWPAEIIAPAED